MYIKIIEYSISVLNNNFFFNLHSVLWVDQIETVSLIPKFMVLSHGGAGNTKDGCLIYCTINAEFKL